VRTRGLRLHLPEYSIAGSDAAGIEPVQGFQPGDFLLSRAHGLNHRLIRFGQNLRLQGEDKRYAGYTHAALVTSASGDVIEAIGEGVTETSLKQYVIDNEVYQVVRITTSDADRQKVVDFVKFARKARKPYAFLANISITLWAFTGSRLVFFLDGSFTCSGLVAEALVRTGAQFDMSSARVMPAQLAVFFNAPPPPPDPPRPERGSLRRRR
jgi:hypothetical protein